MYQLCYFTYLGNSIGVLKDVMYFTKKYKIGYEIEIVYVESDEPRGEGWYTYVKSW